LPSCGLITSADPDFLRFGEGKSSSIQLPLLERKKKKNVGKQMCKELERREVCSVPAGVGTTLQELGERV
jgi:hypothetical protein